MAAKVMTKEKVKELKELWNAGFAIKDIAAEFGITDHTVRYYCGVRQKTHAKVTKELEAKMEELKNQGLSNSKIGIELGLSTSCVKNHIGKQNGKRRAEYGCIVSHVTGESFVNNDIPVKTKKHLRVSNIQTTFKGSGDRTYEASTDGTAAVRFSTGTAFHFTKIDLSNYISELSEVLDWLNENVKEEKIGLDGKPLTQK